MPRRSLVSFPAAVILALSIVGLAIRLAAVDAQSFWFDEAITVEIASTNYHDILTGAARDDGNPPLYWILARAWSQIFGTSERAMHVLPGILSTLAIPFVYLIARRIADERAALTAAAIFAFSPCAFELANEARCYSTLHLVAAISTWMFLRWLDRATWGRTLLYGVSIALACLTHYYAFVLPAVHGLALLTTPEGRRRTGPFVLAMGIAAVCFSFWAPTFLEQLRTPGNLSRMGNRWSFQFFATPLVFGFGRLLVWRGASNLLLAMGTVVAVLLLWVPAGLAVWSLRRNRLVATLLTGWCLLPFLGPLFVALLATPLYSTRYATVGLPAFVILVGIGWTRLRPTAAFAVQFVALALALVSFSNYSRAPIKADWRTAVPLILAHANGADPIVFDAEFEIESFKYYAARRGPALPTFYGIDAYKPGDRVEGVVYQNGVRRDRRPKPLNAELLSQRSLWLILSEPAGSLPEYRRLFRRAGYTPTETHELCRLTVARFQRTGTEKAVTVRAP